MKSDERQAVLVHSIQETEAACKKLNYARDLADRAGKGFLKGAYCYLYGAMLADFVWQCKQGDWIGPEVRLNDSTVQPTDEFLMDYLFTILFEPIAHHPYGPEFLAEVKRRAYAINEYRARAAAA